MGLELCASGPIAPADESKGDQFLNLAYSLLLEFAPFLFINREVMLQA